MTTTTRGLRARLAGGGRATVQPRLDHRGELQCPRNFVIRGNLCVSLW